MEKEFFEPYLNAAPPSYVILQHLGARNLLFFLQDLSTPHNNTTTTTMPGFAQKHMEQHGWSEGKGLGRNESGMKSAIKVKLKNNTMGLGHDQGAEFTFHWWDHIFNKAANSFKVNESEDGGVQLEKCEGKKLTPLLISNKRGLPTRLANKSLMYGTFVKAGTYDSSKVTLILLLSFGTIEKLS